MGEERMISVAALAQARAILAAVPRHRRAAPEVGRSFVLPCFVGSGTFLCQLPAFADGLSMTNGVMLLWQAMRLCTIYALQRQLTLADVIASDDAGATHLLVAKCCTCALVQLCRRTWHDAEFSASGAMRLATGDQYGDLTC